MSFVDQDPNKTTPKNPSTFKPFGAKFFNEEQKLLNQTLEAIETLISNSVTPPQELTNAEQLTIGGGLSDVPTFNPSVATILNRATNTANVEVTVNTAGSGPVTYSIPPGNTLNFDYYKDLVYEITLVENLGSIECEYYSQLFG